MKPKPAEDPEVDKLYNEMLKFTESKAARAAFIKAVNDKSLAKKRLDSIKKRVFDEETEKAIKKARQWRKPEVPKGLPKSKAPPGVDSVMSDKEAKKLEKKMMKILTGKVRQPRTKPSVRIETVRQPRPKSHTPAGHVNILHVREYSLGKKIWVEVRYPLSILLVTSILAGAYYLYWHKVHGPVMVKKKKDEKKKKRRRKR